MLNDSAGCSAEPRLLEVLRRIARFPGAVMQKPLVLRKKARFPGAERDMAELTGLKLHKKGCLDRRIQSGQSQSDTAIDCHRLKPSQ